MKWDALYASLIIVRQYVLEKYGIGFFSMTAKIAKAVLAVDHVLGAFKTERRKRSQMESLASSTMAQANQPRTPR